MDSNNGLFPCLCPALTWTRKIFLLLLLMGMTTSTTNLLFQKNDTCSYQNCRCYHEKVKCVNYIPFNVPLTTKEIIMSQIDPAELVPGRFCQVSWTNVEVVSISVDSQKNAKPKYFNLIGGVFECLETISAFKLRSRFLQHFSKYAFTGLKNIVLFDLSHCRSIHWSDLYKTLAESKNFPKLTQLILAGSGLYYTLKLNQNFINALALRPIAYLDISFLSFVFDFHNSSKLCETLVTFSYVGSPTDCKRKFKQARVCESLKVLNASQSVALKKDIKTNMCVNYSIELQFNFAFFGAVQVIYINEIVTQLEEVSFSNCSFLLYINTSIRKLHFSRNFLPNFDAKLFNDRLTFINLSRNAIQNINRQALKNLSSLEEIDLSNNQLFSMHALRGVFSELFRYTRQIKVINLSSNKLTYLPTRTFASNINLKELDLSNNTLQQITFDISYLLNLSFLDLRFNAINYLDKQSQTFLDNLYNSQKQLHNTTFNNISVQVLLDGNPLSCTCESLEFLQWFVVSPIFLDIRHNYHCKLYGKSIEMNDGVVNVSKEDCERVKRKRLIVLLSSTLSPTVIVASIIAFVIVYKRRKKKMLYQRMEDQVTQLRENTIGFRYPVFLSYSSDDRDFVAQFVLDPLQRHLQDFSGVDRDLICFADKDFIPGRTILSEIFRCLRETSVFVAVISKNYCRSEFCRYEIEQAYLTRKNIIPMFKEMVDEHEMNETMLQVFRHFTRVNFAFEDGYYKIQPDWAQICESIIDLM